MIRAIAVTLASWLALSAGSASAQTIEGITLGASLPDTLVTDDSYPVGGAVDGLFSDDPYLHVLALQGWPTRVVTDGPDGAVMSISIGLPPGFALMPTTEANAPSALTLGASDLIMGQTTLREIYRRFGITFDDTLTTLRIPSDPVYRFDADLDGSSRTVTILLATTTDEGSQFGCYVNQRLMDPACGGRVLSHVHLVDTRFTPPFATNSGYEQTLISLLPEIDNPFGD
ncbi:MAG: hypothetical protein AAGL89_12750 [Pseudomonadota bacterium]